MLAEQYDPQTGKPISARTVQRRLNALTRAANVNKVRPHDLRRSFITVAAESGADSRHLQGVLGHRSEAVAKGYVRESGGAVQQLRQETAHAIAAQLGEP